MTIVIVEPHSITAKGFAGKYHLVIDLQICEIVATERLFLLAQVHLSVLGSDGDHKIITHISPQAYFEIY